NKESRLLVSGTGEVIETDDGILAIGSGGNFALSAGRALVRKADHLSASEIAQTALEIAGEICVYTNDHITLVVLDDTGMPYRMEIDYTPKQIVGQLDKYIIGQDNAKKAVAVALRNRYRRMQLDDSLKDEIVPKNILMIGPTGVGKTEIARRLAKLVRAPFIKVEATKFTEVGYVGRDVESMVRDLVEVAVHMVKKEKMNEVKDKAEVEV